MDQVVLTGGLVFVRLAAVISGLPIFGSLGAPRQAIIVISLALAVLITPHVMAAAIPSSLFLLVLVLAAEILWGMLVTMGIRIMFSAVSTAGEMMGLQMGLALATMFDPLSRESSSALGTLAIWLSGMVFLGAGLHLQVIELISLSFATYPPGQMSLDVSIVPALAEAAGHHFALGVQLAGPLIALHFVLNVLMALLTRLAPRMNVFFALGLTATSVVGMLLLEAAMPWLLTVHLDQMRAAVHQFGTFLGL